MHKSKNKEHETVRKELKNKNKNNEMVGVKSNHISNYLKCK